MALKDSKLISLSEIEGADSPHRKQIDRALQSRKEALEYVKDVSKLAEYIGGRAESLGAVSAVQPAVSSQMKMLPNGNGSAK